ncbi:LysR family transcriptional regulator [Jiella sp. MQZ9-1]|uniref:LysR family transcriptional regulator n=1 Tax=Jiella flava TaxID=2816857 RepID=A0A939JYC8_9HYPH|nr:LysR family transcriptional regulator [Jiella flava]MBO0664281.1 LysR family transcriptional regulator [Jiella flava]MCD2472796.1 LysR family transcriptional regulator [Jiella flava]
MPKSFVHVHLVALRYFAEAARAGSMRQASDFLSIAPSAVNRQILKLEDQLQVRLFDRVADGVKLTAAGEVLYGYISNLQRDLDKAIAQIDDMRGLRRGHVRIALEDGIARDFFGPELAKFSKEYPGISYSLIMQEAAKVMECLADGEADIGLSVDPPTRSDIRRIAALPIPTGAIMRPDHPLASRASVTLSDLAGERMVLGSAGYGGGGPVNHILTEGGRHRPFIEINTSDSALDLVLAGLGLAVRSPVGIMERLGRGDLVFVPLSGRATPKMQIVLWTQMSQGRSNAAAVLLQRLTAALPLFSEKLEVWRVADA